MAHVPENVFRKAKDKAVLTSIANKPPQRHYNDLTKFRLSTDAKPAGLLRLYKTIYANHVGISSAIIAKALWFATVEKPDSRGVPVSIPHQDLQHQTFHIIELVGPPGDLGPILQIPVRQEDSYCMGFRVLHPGEDDVSKAWFACMDAEFPRHLFPTVRPCAFSMAYNNICAIVIKKGILGQIHEYFSTFEINERATADGVILKDTVFFMFGEGQRFWCAQSLCVHHMNSISPGQPSPLMSTLIHEWHDISKAILKLWLAVLEEEEGLLVKNLLKKKESDQLLVRMHRLEALKTKGGRLISMEEAIVLLNHFMVKFSPLISFKRDGVFDLGSLAGKSLHLIKNCNVDVLKVLMRKDGYWRIFRLLELLGSS